MFQQSSALSVNPSAEPLGPRPSASQPGVFPREYIPAGETILYETKPSVWAFISPISAAVVVVLFTVLTWGVVLPSVSSSSTDAASSNFVMEEFIVLFIVLVVALPLGLIGGLARWRASSYAITDRRVLMSYGILSRSVVDCMFDKIQNVGLTQGFVARLYGYGSVVFQTAGLMATQPRAVLRGGGVYWLGVKDPVNTRRFVSEASDYFRQEQKAVEYQQLAGALRNSGISPSVSVHIPASFSSIQDPKKSPAGGSGLSSSLLEEKAGAPTTRPCPYCGVWNDAEYSYCFKCGKALPTQAGH